MKVKIVKAFLHGSSWLEAGDTLEVDEKQAPALLRSGVVALVREEPEETATARMDHVETAVRRGPGRPRKED
jgi:hypothetical protein